MFPAARDQRGSILVLAAWSLTLLGVLAASLGYGVRQKASLVVRLERHEQLARLAMNGVEKARDLMKMPDATPGLDTLMENWANQQDFQLTDEESKVNLNTADTETLTRLLRLTASLDADEAEEIAYAIVDWRDTDSTHQHAQYGAEDEDYAGLAKPYEAKDQPLDALEEVLLVKGMKRTIFDKIRDTSTVYGGGVVNINTARRETLEALGLGAALVGKVFVYRNGADGTERTPDDRYFSGVSQITTELQNVVSIDAVEETTLSNLISVDKLSTGSEYFMVRSRAAQEGRGAIEARAVIDRNGKIHYCRLFKA